MRAGPKDKRKAYMVGYRVGRREGWTTFGHGDGGPGGAGTPNPYRQGTVLWRKWIDGHMAGVRRWDKEPNGIAHAAAIAAGVARWEKEQKR